MNPSELYMHHYQNSEPKFYTRVPNIIDHLTYDVEEDGVKVSKRLSVYAKELYRVIRMIASDQGKDWHTTESLAEIVGCSVGSIINAKKELLMPMNQLEGNALIIEERSMGTRMVGDNRYKCTLCKRAIVDIWKWNNAFMATMKYQNKFGIIPDSPHESGLPPDSCGESGPQGPDSYGEANNNKNNNIPMSNKQQPTASAVPVCLLNAKGSYVSVRSAPPSDDVAKHHNFNLLTKMGYDVLSAMGIVDSFSGQDLQRAFLYLEAQKKKKSILNPLGYFRKILEGKWWMKSPA